jgi:hypothetical protein
MNINYSNPCGSFTEFCKNKGVCKSYKDTNVTNHKRDLFSQVEEHFNLPHFNCTCVGDYTGEHCDIKKNKFCKANVCLNGGTCNDWESSYECECADGFAGIHCEIDCKKALNKFQCLHPDVTEEVEVITEYFIRPPPPQPPSPQPL